MENFLSAENAAKHAQSSYQAGKKKLVPTRTPSKSSIFPLLKYAVHTFNMQHHLIKLCVEYTNTLNPQQVTKVDCLDQPIHALLEFAFSEYFTLFARLCIEKVLLITKEHLVSGT